MRKTGTALCAALIALTLSAGASAAQRAERTYCEFQIVDAQGGGLANMGLEFSPKFDAPEDFAVLERIERTDADGRLGVSLVPGEYTLRVHDPKQSWVLGGGAPVQLFSLQIRASENGLRYGPLTWRGTTPDDYLEGFREKAVFLFTDQRGLPAANLEVHLDYQKNRDAPGYGDTPGGYTDREGRYTYIRPLEKDVVLFVYDSGDRSRLTTYEVTLPSLTETTHTAFSYETTIKTDPS